MKKTTLLVFILIGIAIIFDSCKKDTVYKMKITGYLIDSIKYSVNGSAMAFYPTLNTDFDAKEGDNISVRFNINSTVGVGGLGGVMVYGYVYDKGKKEDDWSVFEKLDGHYPETPELTFTLPHKK